MMLSFHSNKLLYYVKELTCIL